MSVPARRALVLFDIDGTLLRKAGPHHRRALEEAVRRVFKIETTTEGIPVAGMLDRDILRAMLEREGVPASRIRRAMPDLVRQAQTVYVRGCPDLRRRVCPGARALLYKLRRRAIPASLVTGNLTRIGWHKMERAGLRHYFSFGAFAEMAQDRAGLARLAIEHARRERWIDSASSVALIGDHPNDIRAARANSIRSIAVTTGIIPRADLAVHSPDLLLDDMRGLTVERLLG